MNHRSVGLIGVALTAVFVASPARAQSAVPAWTTDVGLAVGAVLPQGDRIGGQDVVGGPNTGFTVVGSIGVRPASSVLGFRFEAQYTRFGVDEETRVEIGGEVPAIVDGHVRVLGGTANVLLAAPNAGRVRPYLIGGLGVYRLSSDIGYTSFEGRVIGNGAPSPSETEFGLNGGAGIELAIGPLRTVVEARFHSVFAESDRANLVPITIGMRF